MANYNGYANYETWAVSLWLGNEQSSQEYWLSVAADQMRRARMFPVDYMTVSQDARTQLADGLKDELTEAAPDLGASMYADLLGAALESVDWLEIADNLLADSDGYEALERATQPVA